MRLEADIILFNSFAFNYSSDRDHGRNFLIIKKKKNISNESDYFSKDWKENWVFLLSHKMMYFTNLIRNNYFAKNVKWDIEAWSGVNLEMARIWNEREDFRANLSSE